MSTPTDQLPQELKDAIEMEANLYEHESQRAVSADEYIQIATTYAQRAYRAEQEVERLKGILCLEIKLQMRLHQPGISEIEQENSWLSYKKAHNI